jgi:hypothetical protein
MNSNWVAIVGLISVTIICSLSIIYLGEAGKDIGIAGVSGIVGFLSKEVISSISNYVADRRKTEGPPKEPA